MKIWLSKNSEVPIREQLLEQISIGIASGDLHSGERLPSVREIARRFQIHPNTVSSVYRNLAENGLVEFRKGSGVFVANQSRIPIDEQGAGDLIGRIIDEARKYGVTPIELRSMLDEYLASSENTLIVLVESDLRLQEILAAEIQESLRTEVKGVRSIDPEKIEFGQNLVITAMYDERDELNKRLKRDTKRVFLKVSSVANTLSGRTRPDDDDMVAVVSGWAPFLSLAKLFLVAANIDPDTIITRSTCEKNWQSGLDQAAIIICDVVSARKLENHDGVAVFRIISKESLNELKELADWDTFR